MGKKRGTPKNLEEFLRKYFNLHGKFHSDEFEAVIKAEENGNEDAISDWFEDHEPADCYTPEAWSCWGRAIEMVDDLAAMGIVSKEGGMDSEYDRFVCWFCDNS